MSFVVGRWETISETRGERTLVMYHRETDPQKIAQSAVVFDQIFASIDWMEEFTGVPCPFPKYDLIVVPGFQFGGMEHPGAVLYNARRIFLAENPTPDAALKRRELLAHETAHLWFGDAVTMEWFNDVWTKEVFANYFAAQICSSQSADHDHSSLNELRNFYVPAYTENRTAGATSVKQHLPNLQDAGLIYGQMVYYKAPIVMRMLVDRVGKEGFQRGMQEYMQTYLYGNSTWEDIVAILDKQTDEDLVTWARTWVSEKAMAQLSATFADGTLTITQTDPTGQGLVWQQNMDVLLLEGDRQVWKRGIALDAASVEVDLTAEQLTNPCVILNATGIAYGYCELDASTIDLLLLQYNTLDLTPASRLALLINLFENYVHGRVAAAPISDMLNETQQTAQESLVVSAAMLYFKELLLRGEGVDAALQQQRLLALASAPHGKGCQQLAFSALVHCATEADIVEQIYEIWNTQRAFDGLNLSEANFITMSYELALRRPSQYETITSTQLERISNPDRQAEYRFVMHAVHPAKAVRDDFFRSLLEPENRTKEPWVNTAQQFLNHPLRQQEALGYIRPSLDEMLEVQRTGDIFFPKNWIVSVLTGHNSREARAAVQQFLDDNPAYPQLLKNKILQAADHLLRD